MKQQFKDAIIDVMGSAPLKNRKGHVAWEHKIKITHNDVVVCMGVIEMDKLHAGDTSNFMFNRLISSNMPNVDDAYESAYNFWDKMSNRIVDAIELDKKLKTVSAKTKKRFGNIIKSIHESKEVKMDHVLIIKSTYDAGGISNNTYKIIPIDKMSSKEKKEFDNSKSIIRNKSGTITRRNDYSSSSICFIMGNDEKMLKRTIKSIADYNRPESVYEPERELKPETEKRFGNIFRNLDESVKPEKWVLILTGAIKKSGTMYKLKRVEDLSSQEKEKLKSLEPFFGFSESWHVKVFSNRDDCLAFYGLKHRVLNILDYYKGQGYKMVEIKKLKKETKSRFGGLISNMDIVAESKREEWVLIERNFYDKNHKIKSIRYTMKLADALTDEEKDVLKNHMRRMHSYKKGYLGSDVLDAGEVTFVFDTKEQLNKNVKNLYAIYGNMVKEEKPMKPETSKRFRKLIYNLSDI